VPVAPPEAVDALAREVDKVVCLWAPETFFAIGVHYVDFHQISDKEVVKLLADHAGKDQRASRDERADEKIVP
jgi:putative phosphoribosyl transferase